MTCTEMTTKLNQRYYYWWRKYVWYRKQKC